MFTEEQEMLRASARDFLEKECTEDIIEEIESGSLGYSPELWQKIAELGWLGLVYPEEYGGTGMNLVDLAVLYEEFGRAMLPSPYTSAAVLGGLIILEAGNDSQKSGILPEIINGEEIIVLALNESEPVSEGMKWSPEKVTVKAESDGGEYLLSGVNMFVHYANIAGTFLVPARTKTEGNPEECITLFLVDAGSPGVSVTRLTTIAGDNQCEIVFSNVRVAAENIVGNLNYGWPPLSRSLQVASLMYASQMLGAGERMLKDSEEDYMTRLESGIPDDIKKHNEEYLAVLKQDIDACRYTVYQAAEKLAEGKSIEFDSNIAASWSSYARQNS